MSIGCLVLHGFTSCSDSVNRIPVRLIEHGIPFCMPILRGHGTEPADLLGVTWHDWFADAQTAYVTLLQDVEQVLVVGLSMGALLALHLAAARPQTTAGVVALAPAMRFYSKRVAYSNYIAPFKPMWGDPQRDPGAGWDDPELGRRHGNYLQFPVRTFTSLYRYAQIVEQQLPRVTAPALIIHSHADKTIPPQAAEAVFAQINSTDKQLIWFDRSGHEMLRDSEAPAVLDCVETFILDHIFSPASTSQGREN